MNCDWSTPITGAHLTRSVLILLIDSPFKKYYQTKIITTEDDADNLKAEAHDDLLREKLVMSHGEKAFFCLIYYKHF